MSTPGDARKAYEDACELAFAARRNLDTAASRVRRAEDELRAARELLATSKEDATRTSERRQEKLDAWIAAETARCAEKAAELSAALAPLAEASA
jgi:hypothetical protein